MRTKRFSQLLRGLLLAAGAGAGMAVAFLCVEVNELTTNAPIPLGVLILLYVGMGALGALGAHLLAPRLLQWWHGAMADLERSLDALSAIQLLSMAVWFIGALLVAALLNQVLLFLGDSFFSMAISAIVYVVMSVIGLSIGARRADDMALLLRQGRSGKKVGAACKMLDASILMDGRIVGLKRTGVIEGSWMTADFILAELQEAASSSDAAKKLRAQRGLDIIRQLQGDEGRPLTIVTTETSPVETDVALMSLAREKGATLLTADPMMHKAARVAGVPVINLNDVALALRTVTVAGDVLMVRITKEGREHAQGVGYLEDGTMVVVENGRERMGQTVEAVVTSVLQTSAGRMAFAKPAESGEATATE